MVRSYRHKIGNTIKWLTEDDLLHREDGPAIAHSSGTKMWYINNKLHRMDGPAIEYFDGVKVWYFNDTYAREPFYNWADKMNIDLDKLTEDDKILIAIVWSDYGK